MNRFAGDQIQAKKEIIGEQALRGYRR